MILKIHGRQPQQHFVTRPNLPKIAQAGAGAAPLGCCRSCGAVSQGSTGRCHCCLAAAGSGSAHASRCDFRHANAAQYGGQQRFRSCRQRDTASQCCIGYFAGSLRGYPCRNRIERANLTYSDMVDSVGGHVSYNAFQLISMYCAYQGEDDYTKISLTDLSEQVQAHQTEYYAYTTSEEVRTEPVQKEVRGQTITVQRGSHLHRFRAFLCGR